VPLRNANLRRLWRRIVIVLMLAIAAIYALVRALDLDVGRRGGYLGGSVLLVMAAALSGLVAVAIFKVVRRSRQ